jgi:hypothetical protein
LADFDKSAVGVRVRKKRPRRSPDYTPGFLDNWKTYPHWEQRSQKAESFRVWRDLGLEWLAGNVKLWISACSETQDWTLDGGKRVPGMQVWLKKYDFHEPPVRPASAPIPLSPEEKAERRRRFGW